MKQLILLALLTCLPIIETQAYPSRTFSSRSTYSKLHRSTTWATQITIDLHDCSYSKVRSQHELQRFINKLCSWLGVTQYNNVELLYHYRGNGYTSGYTATQQANGHTDIAIRVNEENNSVYIDLFSCAPYDPYEIAQRAREFFYAYDMNYNVTYRK